MRSVDPFTWQRQRQLDTVHNAWERRAAELSSWAWAYLVNRTDASGAYTAPEQRGKSYTRRDGTPGVVPKNYTRKKPLYRDELESHFRGLRHEHVRGLHSTGPANTCRWGAFDIDRHDEATDPALTLRRAASLYAAVEHRGFRPLLIDSNGLGGYHIWLILRVPVPSADLYHLLRQIARETDFPGEQFPKQAALSRQTRYGNWLRLPGRHHSRQHWSQVFDGKTLVSGDAAIDHILSYRGDDAALVPPAPAEPVRPRTPRKPGPPLAGGGRSLDERIARYVAKCPNLGEGEGRDDVAYRLAAFLVRNLALADPVALDWLDAWDAGNRPPKGRQRLSYIIGSVHRYGQQPYGSGLEGGAS